MARLTDEDLFAFVEASCRAQGIPVKVTDAKVVGEVAALIRAGTGRSVSRASGSPTAGPGPVRAAR